VAKFAMVLRKIIGIKNVGRFQSYGASGDVTLKRYNLIYAENGRGKTTFCAILRSLQTGDPTYVSGRATLGSPDVPEITILTDAGAVAFNGGIWSATVPALAIFDSTFVSENVYSGDFVDLDHRRNLYRVIIGKDGVDLARRVDQLDADIRVKTSEIREKRAAVQSFAPSGVAVESFLVLAPDPDIDSRISTKQMELESVRQADQLRSRASLSLLALPALPDDFEVLLATTVEGLAADAEQQVSAQIAAHEMHARGETWLSEGLRYVRDETCPFCNQPLHDSPLIRAYSAYFSEAYHTLKKKISELTTVVQSSLGDRAIAQAERTLEGNDAASEFWARYCEFSQPVISYLAGVGAPLRAFRQAAVGLLDQKTAAPLDRIPLDDAYADALHTAESLRDAATDYNEAVRVVNSIINSKKEALGNADVRTTEADLRQLEAIKSRHQPAAAAASHAYETAITEKRMLEEQKEAARDRLDKHTKQVIGLYEKTINDLLEDFQAGFRITGTKHAYPGGVPSSSFQILINDTTVDLGDSDTPLDRPSFRNTLSSGDRSTLALAFFLADLSMTATNHPELLFSTTLSVARTPSERTRLSKRSASPANNALRLSFCRTTNFF
jgi:wobble nucleotide-excising tRNase